MLNIKLFHFGALQACCAVVWKDGGKGCAVIDPGMFYPEERPQLTDYIDAQGLSVDAILLTHGHFDHFYGAGFLQKRTGAKVYIHPRDVVVASHQMDSVARLALKNHPYEPFEPTDVAEGDSISAGGISWRVLETPGHSPGGVAYIDDEDAVVFPGDTLFAGSIGRTDLEDGDYDILMDSLLHKILTLPDEYEVIPGHGPSTTIGAEALTNPFLQPFNEPLAQED